MDSEAESRAMIGTTAGIGVGAPPVTGECGLKLPGVAEPESGTFEKRWANEEMQKFLVECEEFLASMEPSSPPKPPPKAKNPASDSPSSVLDIPPAITGWEETPFITADAEPPHGTVELKPNSQKTEISLLESAIKFNKAATAVARWWLKKKAEPAITCERMYLLWVRFKTNARICAWDELYGEKATSVRFNYYSAVCGAVNYLEELSDDIVSSIDSGSGYAKFLHGLLEDQLSKVDEETRNKLRMDATEAHDSSADAVRSAIGILNSHRKELNQKEQAELEAKKPFFEPIISLELWLGKYMAIDALDMAPGFDVNARLNGLFIPYAEIHYSAGTAGVHRVPFSKESNTVDEWKDLQFHCYCSSYPDFNESQMNPTVSFSINQSPSTQIVKKESRPKREVAVAEIAATLRTRRSMAFGQDCGALHGRSWTPYSDSNLRSRILEDDDHTNREPVTALSSTPAPNLGSADFVFNMAEKKDNSEGKAEVEKSKPGGVESDPHATEEGTDPMHEISKEPFYEERHDRAFYDGNDHRVVLSGTVSYARVGEVGLVGNMFQYPMSPSADSPPPTFDHYTDDDHDHSEQEDNQDDREDAYFYASDSD